MRNIILLGALVMFAFTASAQSDAQAFDNKKEITKKEIAEKVCTKTGKKCDETCANKKTDSCCEGKKGVDKKACSKEKEGVKNASCCSKGGDKKACSRDGRDIKGEKSKETSKPKTKVVSLGKKK